MRRFSDREKEMIRRIHEARKNVDGTSHYGMDLLFEIFEGDDISMAQDTEAGSRIVAGLGEDIGFPPVDKRYEIAHDIFDAAQLLKNLEAERLITYLEDKDRAPLTTLVLQCDREQHEFKIPEGLRDIFEKETFGKSKVTETLHALCLSDFKTPDDLALDEAKRQTAVAHAELEEARRQTLYARQTLDRATCQTKWAAVAVVISLLSLLLSLLLSFSGRLSLCS